MILIQKKCVLSESCGSIVWGFLRVCGFLNESVEYSGTSSRVYLEFEACVTAFHMASYFGLVIVKVA